MRHPINMLKTLGLVSLLAGGLVLGCVVSGVFENQVGQNLVMITGSLG